MLVRKSAFQRQHPVLARKIKKNVIRGITVWLIATLFFPLLLLGYTFYDFSPQCWIMVAFVWAFYLFLVLCLFVYYTAHFKIYYYDLTDKHLIIVKGVFQRQETVIAYEHIRDVSIDQDTFDRFFHLYDVHISTISRILPHKVHIDGVSLETAEKIKELILSKVHALR